MSMPMICSAAWRASAADFASLMPPALPRPPTGTWALTAIGPSFSNAAAASWGLRATMPGGIAIPSKASTSLAWYSRSFNLLRRRVEGAGQVGIAARVPVAEPALEVGVGDQEDRSAYAKDQHDDQGEAAADEHRRHGRDAAALGRGTGRPPGGAVPILLAVVGDPPALGVLCRHRSKCIGAIAAGVFADSPRLPSRRRRRQG